MEAFSLLKYWRGGGGGGGLGGAAGGGGSNACVNARSAGTAGGTTTIVTAVTTHQAVDTDDDDDDDGPFFDLEFAVPDEDETEENEEIGKEEDNVEDEESEDQIDDFDAKSDDGGSDGEREFNFTLSSGSINDRSDPNLTLSPSDDLFFKGRLVPIEPNSSLDSKPPQFPVSLLKSATKFRVFLLRFKKSKLNSTEKTESASANGSVSVPTATPKKQDTTQEENNNNNSNNNNKNKFFTVKFKVEEVPIMSLFSRDNSKSQKQQISEDSVSDEKKFSKDVMQKYLKKVKPLYVRVSRRYGEKLRFSGQLSLSSLKPATPPSTAAQKSVSGKVTTTEKGQVEVEVGESQVNGKNLKQVNFPAGLRVVCKHLGKSRSASSAVAAAPPVPALSQRRDDSLLQQQDGIQSAILHCKRSFNGSRDSSESSVLPRSVSDPSHEKSINLSRKSTPDEAKE
ncbi:Uncharacterized protein TCM_016357 isoform 1 [Theobroma cacao]|uniref:Uncharacterized protein isoform 1 n=1 Tax=Theobroma cacao TaxID=3641 RepID=A0A061GCT9_THECC|nr:Uncharacterized protein TCM_016357 isoform 1 [Theobroma cacao]